MKTTNQNLWSKTQLGAAALGLVTVLSVAGCGPDKAAAPHAPEVVDPVQKHLQERHCVVAESDKNKVPTLYKCDLPKPNEFVDPKVLKEEATPQKKVAVPVAAPATAQPKQATPAKH